MTGGERPPRAALDRAGGREGSVGLTPAEADARRRQARTERTKRAAATRRAAARASAGVGRPA